MKTIGLIGGTSWESTAVYYRLLNEGVRARCGGLRSARIVLHSVDFAPLAGAMERDDWQSVGTALAGAARSVTAAGADCIATACPLCQLNLDLRQRDIERKFDRRYNLPVFYFTQLLGLAMGCGAGELSLSSLVVEPRALLASIGI